MRLASDSHRKQVIDQESYWQDLGISAVPTVVFNRQSALSGAQPIDAYKQVLLELIADM